MNPKKFLEKVSFKLGDYVVPKLDNFNSLRKSKNFMTTVIKNERLTSFDHSQDIRFLELKSPKFKYEPGDTLVVRPKNVPSVITKFQQILANSNINFSNDEVFTASSSNIDVCVSSILNCDITFEELCRDHFDLTAVPNQMFFKTLSHLTDNEREVERCLKLASENSYAYLSYVFEPQRSVIEVLRDFPHATGNIRKDILLGLLPTIKPRIYSIASSYKFHGNVIHILLAINEHKLKPGKTKIGLASQYLGSLQKGDKFSAWYNRGSFKFPRDRTIPIIMVGRGIGLSPFRNYAFERHSEINSNPENLILLFGCTDNEKDFLFKSELEYLHRKKILNLITAFSYKHPHEPSIFVQHKIIQHKNLIWGALKKGGYIFVAGNETNSSLEEIREAFVTACAESGKKKQAEAAKYVDHLEKIGRYQTDTYCLSY